MQAMDEVLSIGRFARLSGLSVGALRHYDEIGLLVPAEVDPWTAYRRYHRSQLDRGRTIARLRELDLPLDEMTAVLDSTDELERLAALDRHRLRIEARVARGQHVLHHIRGLMVRKEPIVSHPPMPPELDPSTQRALAAGLYNYTWTLLERDDRSAEDVDRMIHAAHASRLHWDAIGLPANRSRGEWLCSRVYAVLGRASPRCGMPAGRSPSSRPAARGSRTGTCRRSTRRWPGRTPSPATRSRPGSGETGPGRHWPRWPTPRNVR